MAELGRHDRGRHGHYRDGLPCEGQMQSDSDDLSPRSTGQLPRLLWSHLFSQWFFGYFLVGVLWIAVKSHERRQEVAEERASVNQIVDDTREAVRRGEAGEAFKQLFPDDHERFLDAQAKRGENNGAAHMDHERSDD